MQRHQAYCRSLVTEAKLELAEEVLDFSNRNIQLTMEILFEGNEDIAPLLLERANNSARIAALVQRIREQVDSEQGKELLDAASVRWVSVHISLPVMNGWEATRLLKTNESTRHIPIVALTAHALVTDRQKALEAGCDDYDTKPVDFERLNEKIENLLVPTP